jgi:hypothetical protein
MKDSLGDERSDGLVVKGKEFAGDSEGVLAKQRSAVEGSWLNAIDAEAGG